MAHNHATNPQKRHIFPTLLGKNLQFIVYISALVIILFFRKLCLRQVLPLS